MLCAIQTSWDSLQCAARVLPCLLDKIVEIFSFPPQIHYTITYFFLTSSQFPWNHAE